MVRPRSLLPALVVAAATLAVVPAPPTAAGQAPAASHRLPDTVNDDPLAVTIDTLTPAVVPETGNVTITGMVTNVSEETWTDINVYPLTSTALPMTTVDELDAAAQSPDDLVVGERRLEVSANIPSLAPGEVAQYTLRVPRRYLGQTEGVQWLGVHTLGANSAGRDPIADGKARTFMPYVRGGGRRVKAALVLPLRRRVDHAIDGRVDRPERWATDLAPTGRLGSIVELGANAGVRPITWLIDPAVLVAVNALVAGNASRLPPPADPEGAEPTPTPTEEATATDAPLAPTDEPMTSDPSDPTAVAAAATQGGAWLARLNQAVAGKELLALPYGDVDASAASQLDPDLLADAQTASATTMAALGLPASPALASPRGFVGPDAIAGADPAATVLLTDEAVDVGAPAVSSVGGHEVVLTSSTAVEGGPGPDDPYATVAMRQRILSEAAVRLLSAGRDPLVVALPSDWVPTDMTAFFSGLDVDWLDLSPLSEVTAAEKPSTVDPEDVAYPPFQEEIELDIGNFAAAGRLAEAGVTLQQVLTSTTSLGDAVAREAFADTSYWQRLRSGEAIAAADRSRAWVEATLGLVTVDGPPSVTLSSATGQFPATVRNGLDEPVVVRLVTVPSRGLTVEEPPVISLDAGESVRLRLRARTDAIGAHGVRLVVAAPDGTPLGSSTELPIRSNQVSEIIWIVIAVGGGLLFGAIGLRLVRRVRRARSGAHLGASAEAGTP
ncbi:MAG: DUF6049 family protein [Nocardioides sp.]